jgi:hypothetical protein
MLASFVLAGTAWAATGACGEPLTRDDLRAAIERAEGSLVELDDAGFRDRFNELAGIVVPCMGDLVPPDLAARYHRLMGIHLLAMGDHEAATASVVAARSAAGDLALPGDLLAGELKDAWASASGPGKTRKVPEPRTGAVAFDGVAQRERPVEAPTVVQLFDASGRAVATEYVGAGDPLPTYAAIPRRRNSLIAVGIGGGAVAVGSWLGAALVRGDLFAMAADPSAPADALDSRRATANTLSVVGAIGATVAVGGAAGALAVGPR